MVGSAPMKIKINPETDKNLNRGFWMRAIVSFWKKTFEIQFRFVFDQVYFLESFSAFRDLKEKN